MKIKFFSCWKYQERNDWSVNILRINGIRHQEPWNELYVDEYSIIILGLGIKFLIKN